QLGDGTTTRRLTPTAVSGLSGAVEVRQGARFACARLGDHSLRCWGNNSSGELGDGTTAQRLSPVAVSGVNNAVQLGLGFSSACALLSDNSAVCWGGNGLGALGDQTTISRSVPVAVWGFPCGSGGTSNNCGACVPLTCASLGVSQGSANDGCGG